MGLKVDGLVPHRAAHCAVSTGSAALLPPGSGGRPKEGPMSLRAPGAVLLVSCYELGHQPLSVALPAAFLKRAGFAPAVMDIAVQRLDEAQIAAAQLIAISVPMHTALRLGTRLAQRAKAINPHASICFYGLYAVLNAEYLLAHGADYCIGGEVEVPLVALAEALDAYLAQRTADPHGNGHAPRVDVEGIIQRGQPARPYIARLPFAVPDRESLPVLDHYARLEHNGARLLTGYVEASRGCLHLCTHCPIPPVYGGRFVIIPRDVVLEDIRRQVAAGARHITFGDPDFLNGPKHALAVARALHAAFPEVTFDITTKVEHILHRGEILPELGRLGCLFAVSAVESVSDRVLSILEKNHTRAEFIRAIEVLRAAGIAPRPTWVAFTPWTTRDDYLDMLSLIEQLDLVDHVDPVQYTIRLLIPPGSYLLRRPELQPYLGELDQEAFSYRWAHPDPHMDQLQRQVSRLVEQDVTAGVDPVETFYRVWALASGGDPDRATVPARTRHAPAPRLSEPWFC
jgi:radical SAM superfamily enzyme YgiQ (UPF0313 family)